MKRLSHILLLTLSAFLPALAIPPKTERVYHKAPLELRDTAVTLSNPLAPGETEMLAVQVSASAHSRPRPGEAKDYWGVVLSDADGGEQTEVTVRSLNTSFGDMLDRHMVRLTVSRAGKAIYRTDTDMSPKGGEFNTLRLILTDSMEVQAGKEIPLTLCTLPLRSMPARVSMVSTGRSTLGLFALEADRSRASRLCSGWTADSLRSYLSTPSDPHEGLWHYLDRQNDPRYAVPGGEYSLALVSDGEGGYDIIYIGGAVTLASEWQETMVKGHLNPTPFIDHYKLTWIDAEGELIHGDTTADFTAEGSILALNFPLLKTTIRFARQ